jgi:hypothetical protein
MMEATTITISTDLALWLSLFALIGLLATGVVLGTIGWQVGGWLYEKAARVRN